MTANDSNTHVQLINLVKTYPNTIMPALDNVSAKFQRGKVHSIIGRSGAGKSTLLRCLNHLDIPDSGQILVDGEDLVALSSYNRRSVLRTIGTVFQKFNLLSRRTVLENVMLPLEWGKVDPLQAQEKAMVMIEKVGLKGFENRYPPQLSGGQCQRVAIARALVTDTKLLLCDEFTSALDPETSLEVLELLWHLNQSLEVTVVLITHDMSVVREVSDFVYVMDAGKIVESGPFKDILIHPIHHITKSLLRSELMKSLPPQLEEKLQVSPVTSSDQVLIRLIFFGEATQRPVIADLIKSHDISINILAGGLNHVRGMTFGSLLVSIPQDPEIQQVALTHFSQNDIAVEIIGYLPKGSSFLEVDRASDINSGDFKND